MMYYGVKVGRKPGVYDNWDDTKAQVNKFKGAVQKKFNTKKEAEEFVYGKKVEIKPEVKIEINKAEKAILNNKSNIVEFYVDGSFTDGRSGAGIVILHNGNVLKTYSFRVNNVEGNNVVGEVNAAIFSIAIAGRMNAREIIIYYDYKGVECWATGEWKANKPLSQAYVRKFHELSDGIKVNFVKIKSHTGNTYNEMADQLAAKGCYSDVVVQGL